MRFDVIFYTDYDGIYKMAIVPRETARRIGGGL